MFFALLFPFPYGCCVNTLYKPAIRRELRTIGKCFVINLDDEKLSYLNVHQYNSEKS